MSENQDETMDDLGTHNVVSITNGRGSSLQLIVDLDDPDVATRKRAFDTLVERGVLTRSKSLTDRLPAYTDMGFWIKHGLCSEVLTRKDRDQVYAQLASHIANPDPEVRSLLPTMMGNLKGVRSVPLRLVLLNDSNSNVRYSARRSFIYSDDFLNVDRALLTLARCTEFSVRDRSRLIVAVFQTRFHATGSRRMEPIWPTMPPASEVCRSVLGKALTDDARQAVEMALDAFASEPLLRAYDPANDGGLELLRMGSEVIRTDNLLRTPNPELTPSTGHEHKTIIGGSDSSRNGSRLRWLVGARPYIAITQDGVAILWFVIAILWIVFRRIQPGMSAGLTVFIFGCIALSQEYDPEITLADQRRLFRVRLLVIVLCACACVRLMWL